MFQRAPLPTPPWLRGNRLKIILLTSVCLTSLCLPGVAMGQNGSQQSIEAWVIGLGADDYLSRLKSEEAILEIGSDAIEAIEQAINSPDIEISIRAQRLLASLREKDFQQRRKEFLGAPLDSLESFGFAQWDAFAKYVGRTDQAKRLFIEIVKDQRDETSKQTSPSGVSYLGYLSNEQEQYTPLPTSAVEIAEELFNRLTMLSGQPQKRQPQNIGTQGEFANANPPTADQPIVIQQLSLSPFEANLPKTLVKTVTESVYSDEIRGLITHWIQARKNQNGLTRNQVETIFQFELKNMRADLHKELENEGSKVRLQSAEAIAKTGGADAIKMLEPFVRGSEVVVAYPEPESGKSLKITLGDIAFQLILAIEDQPVKDFGLLPTAGTMLLNDSPIYGFIDRESADEAISKWESNR